MIKLTDIINELGINTNIKLVISVSGNDKYWTCLKSENNPSLKCWEDYTRKYVRVYKNIIVIFLNQYSDNSLDPILKDLDKYKIPYELLPANRYYSLGKRIKVSMRYCKLI